MTILETLNFVAFNPLQNNNPIAVRRRKLIAKIDEQIELAANKDYTPTQRYIDLRPAMLKAAVELI